MTKPPAHGKPAPDHPRHRTGGAPRCTRLAWFVCCLVLAGVLWGGVLQAAAPGNSEYQVKAAFLYNFMKFVDWPGDGLNNPGVLTLGILGRDPFGDALDEVRGKTAKGRRVAVIHLRGAEQMKECDILFICASEKGRLTQIIKEAQNYRLLTVADQEGFCQAGE